MNSYKAGDLNYSRFDDRYTFVSERGKAQPGSRYHKDGLYWKKDGSNDSQTATILCAGDLMCEPLMSEACYFNGTYFFEPCFKQVRKVFQEGDLNLANLETMVTDDFPYAHDMHICEQDGKARYHCNAPTEYLRALRYAGFDGFAQANNHDADCGYEGILDTIKNLDDRGFMHTGLFTSPEDSRVLLIEVNGIKLAVLSYTEFVNRNFAEITLTEEGRDVMLNYIDDKKIKKDVAEAKAKGAEFILAYVHFHGLQYSNYILDRTRAMGQLIADCGVDIIMGSHMHAIQGYEVLKAADNRRVPVIYSLSNFISSDPVTTTHDSLIFRLILARDENGKVVIAKESYVPCHLVVGYQKSSFVVFPTTNKYIDYPALGTTELFDAGNRAAGNIGFDLEREI